MVGHGDEDVNRTNMMPTNCTTFDYDVPLQVAYHVVFLVISAITIIGNGLIIAIYRRVKKARTCSNFCLVLLAVSDLTFGIGTPIIVTLYFVIKAEDLKGSYIQIILYCLFLFSAIASSLGLVAMTYDRFLAIRWPLEYHTTLSSRRKAGLTILVLVPAFVLGYVVPLLWHNHYDPSVCYFDWNLMLVMKLDFLIYILLPLFYVCNLATIGMYIFIFRRIAMSSKRRSQMQPLRTTISKREMRTLKSVLLIFGSYYLCWLPYILVIAIQVYDPGQYLQVPTFITARSVLSLPVSLNSALNPIIFAFRVPVFQAEISKMFCLRKPRGQQSSTISVVKYTDQTKL